MKKYNFTATQDWHFYFSKIFEFTKISNMLEFGLGVGDLLVDGINHMNIMHFVI